MLYLANAEACQFWMIFNRYQQTSFTEGLGTKYLLICRPYIGLCPFSFFSSSFSIFPSQEILKNIKILLSLQALQNKPWTVVFLLNVTGFSGNLKENKLCLQFFSCSLAWCGYLSVIVYCLDLTLLYIHNSRFSHAPVNS